MTEINPPRLETKQIIKATLAALILGTLIFVSAVLPAEYGKDPLGTGKLLGLNRLYQSGEQSETAMSETPTYPPENGMRVVVHSNAQKPIRLTNNTTREIV